MAELQLSTRDIALLALDTSLQSYALGVGQLLVRPDEAGALLIMAVQYSALVIEELLPQEDIARLSTLTQHLETNIKIARLACEVQKNRISLDI